MKVSNKKELVTSVTYVLFKRKNIRLKYTTKLYNDSFDGKRVSCMSNYMYTSKHRTEDMNVQLFPMGWLVLELTSDDNEVMIKESFALLDVTKNLFVRKMAKFSMMVESYLTEEFELIDPTTGKLSKHAIREVDFVFGSAKINIGLCLMENATFGVKLTIDKCESIVSSIDFLDIMYKIKNVDFVKYNMMMLNYFMTMPDDFEYVQINNGYKFQDVYTTSDLDEDVNIITKRSNQDSDSTMDTLMVRKTKNIGW